MGSILRLDMFRRPERSRPPPAAGEPRVVLFTGVRYDRQPTGKGGRDPNGAQPGRRRV